MRQQSSIDNETLPKTLMDIVNTRGVPESPCIGNYALLQRCRNEKVVDVCTRKFLQSARVSPYRVF